mmetsp:Transcript_23550/g.35328  ORF Transcript_23550/g.35328 Transcript_23550/m.35328 type:complete len:128 (+) Transcript_23550:1270-1653(+)
MIDPSNDFFFVMPPFLRTSVAKLAEYSSRLFGSCVSRIVVYRFFPFVCSRCNVTGHVVRGSRDLSLRRRCLTSEIIGSYVSDHTTTAITINNNNCEVFRQTDISSPSPPINHSFVEIAIVLVQLWIG